MTDLKPGDIVLATQFMDPTKKLGAKVLGPATADEARAQTGPRIWIDLNILGVHLPQMYREDELSLATEIDAVAAQLCTECYGYGIIAGPEVDSQCGTCHGSGDPKLDVRITRDLGGVQVQVQERTTS